MHKDSPRRRWFIPRGEGCKGRGSKIKQYSSVVRLYGLKICALYIARYQLHVLVSSCYGACTMYNVQCAMYNVPPALRGYLSKNRRSSLSSYKYDSFVYIINKPWFYPEIIRNRTCIAPGLHILNSIYQPSESSIKCELGWWGGPGVGLQAHHIRPIQLRSLQFFAITSKRKTLPNLQKCFWRKYKNLISPCLVSFEVLFHI